MVDYLAQKRPRIAFRSLLERHAIRVRTYPATGNPVEGKTKAVVDEAIRTRKRSTLRAEIAQGARSADLCHLANMAFRSGLPP